MLYNITKPIQQRLQAFKCEFDEVFNVGSHQIAVMLDEFVFFWSI